MGTHSADCKPRRGRCTRNSKGGPIKVNKKCKYCHELRCAAHCSCARPGSATHGMRRGREAARTRSSSERQIEVRVQAGVDATSAAAPPAPVGRPAAEKTERMDPDTWWSEILGKVRTATDVQIATYCFDDLALFKVLLQRLQDNSRFSLKLQVDREMFEKGTPNQQHSRVSRLQKQPGCSVWLCKGPGHLGSYHVKELIVDRRYLFNGTANFTSKSHNNTERLYKMTGCVVEQSLQDMAAERQLGEKWEPEL